MSDKEYPESMWQLPEFDSYELSGRQADYCICVFIINEGDKFLNQLAKMAPYQKDIDIVIADGGSTDGSTDLDVLKQYGVNTLLVKTGMGKLGAQMRMAFAWALKRGYKGVVTIDGNNKDSIEDIPGFIRKLDEGYDHVQGSRFIPGGHHENTPLSRLLGVKLLHAPVIRLSSGFKYTDTTNGYRAYSEKLLRASKLAIFRNIFTGYELHYYLAIKAAKLGYRCIEIPVSRIYPETGKTPTKISPFRGNLNVIMKLISAALGKYDPS
ncbi:MAG: glycosyltransferase family 2 protein [Gammaproteobacteria bacterium]|nr:glycosyltransferase family 2 protein [Gammaproteobacteria bacterium]